jgi:glycosyltransferase involved in cell wall biosynthesis
MSAPANPLVSVVLPVYNGARYVAEAIRSVLHQDYHPLECIVVDDGSSDKSADIIARYPVRCIAQTQRGPGAARNAGVRASRGELLAFLDQDDQWAPGKLAAQVEALRSNPGTGYVTTLQESRLDAGVDRPSWITETQLRSDSGLFPGMLLVTRETFEKVGPFREELRTSSDADWFFRAKDMAIPHVRVMSPLLIRRIHDRNQSRDVSATHRELLRIARDSIARRSTEGS